MRGTQPNLAVSPPKEGGNTIMQYIGAQLACASSTRCTDQTLHYGRPAQIEGKLAATCCCRVVRIWKWKDKGQGRGRMLDSNILFLFCSVYRSVIFRTSRRDGRPTWETVLSGRYFQSNHAVARLDPEDLGQGRFGGLRGIIGFPYRHCPVKNAQCCTVYLVREAVAIGCCS